MKNQVIIASCLLTCLFMASCASKSKSEMEVEKVESKNVTAVTKETQETVEETQKIKDEILEEKANAAAEKEIKDTKKNNKAQKTAETSKQASQFPLAEGEALNTANCVLKNDLREIENIKKNTGGCGVNYTKFGNKKTVALARYNMNHCTQVYDQIQNNLSQAGFACAEIATDEQNVSASEGVSKGAEIIEPSDEDTTNSANSAKDVSTIESGNKNVN